VRDKISVGTVFVELATPTIFPGNQATDLVV